MFGKRKQATSTADSTPHTAAGEFDSETGLLGAAGFEQALARQIARDLRYGSTSALALFEVAVAEETPNHPLPSPAPFVAETLSKAVRGADLVARVSPTKFAALLIEASKDGAAQFTERVRTRIGSSPYARQADGSALYVRAWAAVAPWNPAYDSVERYALAAETALKATFRGYEAAQEWFRGEGLNKPFIA